MVNGLRVARPLVSDMLRDQGLHSRNIPAPCGFEFVRPARTGHLSESIDQHVQQPGISRSEEHTSELQSLLRSSYAVFCLTKKKNIHDYEKHCVILATATL